MRIHLGHHFYGAGNLGDDFMLAGFCAAMRSLAPQTTYSCAVPFALEPLRRRFPEIEWQPYDSDTRQKAVADCDVWLGLGGSPFQHTLSRWFVDHLVADAAFCSAARKRMFFLGVGVQTPGDLALREVRDICAQAAGIWTRDAASAGLLRAAFTAPPRVEIGADLAHIFFREAPLVPPVPGRLTLVANFDYGAWTGQAALLAAVNRGVTTSDRVWLAQESRELPGAERDLFANLPETERPLWRFVAPDVGGAPLSEVVAHWPSGEWLVTSRYHAALAGAWAGSRIVVIATNEKLRAVAHELQCPVIPVDADTATAIRALHTAQPAIRPFHAAERANDSCREFIAVANAMA